MKILDLDKDNNSVIQVLYEEDIRDISPRMSVTTRVDTDYDFLNDTITFQGNPFICHSVKREPTLAGDGIVAYCKLDGLHKVVDQNYVDVSSLASAFHYKLAKNSTNSRFEYTYQGMHFGSLLYRLRHDSFETNWNRPEQILWLYLDGNGLHSMTLSNMLKQAPVPFSIQNNFQTNYCLIDDTIMSIYDSSDFPNYQKYGPYWSRIMGKKVEVYTTNYGEIGRTFNFKFGDSRVDSKSYVLVYQKFDSRNRAQPWTLTFSEINPYTPSDVITNKTAKTSNLLW